MAFLQTHDWGLRVLKQLEACTVPFPCDIIMRKVGNNDDRSPAVFREFTDLQVILSKCLDAFYPFFCTCYKRIICVSKPQEIWKSPGD